MKGSEAVNAACVLLREAALRTGCDYVTVTVRRDGRARVQGNGPCVEFGVFERWRADADVLPGGALPYPDEALLAMVERHEGDQ